MKKKTEFQEFVIRVTEFILADKAFQENWEKPEYKAFLCENLRRYSEYTSNHKNIVKNLNRLKDNCKFTVEAVQELDLVKSNKWSDVKDVIHQEHILPISEAIRQLAKIDKSNIGSEIDEIFDRMELVVVSKRESKQLDGANGVGLRSKGTPEQRLNAIGAVVHEKYKNNSIR